MALDVARTPDGRRLVVSRRLRAPADAVWDLLTRPARWPEWGPTVSDVDCDDEVIRRGTAGRVRALGLWLPFEVTDCADYRWSWRVAGVRATGHRVRPLGPDRCRASFEVPPLAAGYVVVCDRALRNLERLATGA